jgi:hypothetical protein
MREPSKSAYCGVWGVLTTARFYIFAKNVTRAPFVRNNTALSGIANRMLWATFVELIPHGLI